VSAALKRAIIDQSVAKTRMPHIVKCHYSRLLTLLGGALHGKQMLFPIRRGTAGAGQYPHRINELTQNSNSTVSRAITLIGFDAVKAMAISSLLVCRTRSCA